jgi:hypothetical protein
MKTLMKTCLLATSAAMFAFTLGLSGCGDDSGITDLLPPKHDLAVPTEDLSKPDVDAGDTD